MGYICLKNQEFRSGQHRLIPIRDADLFLIKKWRNEQMHILRQKSPLTDQQQRRYFHEEVRPGFSDPHPHQILFSLLHQERLVGYGGLVHIDWESGRAEVSFLLDTRRAEDARVYEQDFTRHLQMTKAAAFNDLGFHRLFTETFDIRDHHVSILATNGFKPEGRLRDHVIIGDRYVDSLIHGCLKEDESC